MAAQHHDASESELDVLKALWKFGPGTVRQVSERMPRRRRHWAYTTVMTLLHRLEAKGLARSDKSDVAHVFRAAVSREQLLSQRLGTLAKELADGTATPLVRALVEGKKFSRDDVAQLRRLLDEIEE